MHRHHAERRQDPVHHAEDAFLDLAGVVAPGDQHCLARDIDHHADFALGAVGFGNRMKIGRLDDGPFRLEVGVVLGRGLDEHVAGEQAVPGIFGNDPDRQAVGRVGAAIAILNECFLALEVIHHAGVDDIELVGADRLIDRTPPDVVLDRVVLDHEFILGRAAGIFAGLGDKRAIDRQLAFAAAQAGFVELRGTLIPVERTHAREAMIVYAKAAFVRSELIHVFLLNFTGPGMPELKKATADEPVGRPARRTGQLGAKITA